METCGLTGELFERCSQQEVGTWERRTPDSVLASDLSSEEAGRAQGPWNRGREFVLSYIQYVELEGTGGESYGDTLEATQSGIEERELS